MTKKSTSSKPLVIQKATRLQTLQAKLRHRGIYRLPALWLISYLILLSYFFKSFLGGNSYIEIFPSELVLPFFMHALTALLVACSIYYLSRLPGFTHKLVATTILTTSLLGYDGNLQLVSGVVRALVPGLTESDSMTVISLFYMGVLFYISVFAARILMKAVGRYSRISGRDVQLGILTLVAYLFVAPGFSVARVLPAIVRQSSVEPAQLSAQTKSYDSSNKPDIYYIVLDRYTNQAVLRDQFNFDNSTFTNYLDAHGFTVNNDAYSNYPYTAMSIASTLNVDYTKDLTAQYKDADLQSRTLYHNLIRHSSLVQALKKEGYTYYALGSWYGATNKAPLADDDIVYQQRVTAFGFHKRLRGIEASELTKSPYFRFIQIPAIKWWPFNYEYNEHVPTVRRQIQELNRFAQSDSPGGRFIFAHMLVPHEPFAFNADGTLSLTPGNDSAGKPIKQKYVAQVDFINEQVKNLIDAIDEHSGGKSIVVLNADEGPYPQFLNDSFLTPQSGPQTGQLILTDEDMTTWSEDYLKMKFGILQAVRIPEASPESMSNLSSVNAFRIVLNSYFGYALDYLPNCQFGLSRGSLHEFTYEDITERFTPKASTECAQLANPMNQ